MQTVTVTASLCPTGLFHIALFRDGEPAASQWRNVSPFGLATVVETLARASVHPLHAERYTFTVTESTPERCTVEAIAV